MKRESATFANCPVPFQTDRWRCRVLDALDGDTVTILTDRGWFQETTFDIRFASIDTWERHSGSEEDRVKGRLAYEFTRDHAVGKWATLLTRMDREKYGRILGDLLIHDGAAPVLDLSAALRAGGHAKGT